MVRLRAGEIEEAAGQRRQKRRHDPRSQDDVPPPNPPQRELRPRHRPGKEPTGSSSQAKMPRKAPYIMQGGPAPPLSRANPTKQGIAHDIYPRTPPRLQVEFTPEQRSYPGCPRLTRPQLVHGFTVEMARNYYKQDVALREARNKDVYKYEKCEGLERRFWCKLHEDFYASVVMRKSSAPIVPCKYVDWKYYEDMNDPFFNEAITKCK